MKWLLFVVSVFATVDYETVIDRHFQEYQRSRNILGLMNDLAHWKSASVDAIVNMTLVEQSKFSDYVTEMMMKEPKETHLAWIEQSVLYQLSIIEKSRMNAAGYGNMAYALLHISPSNPLWIKLAQAYSKLLV